MARELVSRQIVRGGYGQMPEYTVRVNFHCNQSCDFCFVSTHLPPAGDAAVRAAIEAAGGEAAVLVLSGGEPTMNPRLVEYVRLAKAAGVRGIELQTNATRLDAALAGALAEAGVEQATVSLHASTAELSDAITGAPGTFVQTLRGLEPPSEREAFSSAALPPDAGDGEFVKGDVCGTCSESHRCYGVRRGYAELYGTAELRPFAARSSLSAAP